MVRRDKTGRWRYRKVVRLPNGRKVRISGTPAVNTKLEAENAERNHILLVLNPAPEQKEVPSFKTFVEERWWPVYPDSARNRATTRAEKAAHLRLYLLPHLGRLPLDQVRGEAVDRLLAALKKRNLAAKTIKNIRATLRKILQSAVDWDVLPAVPPIQKVEVPEQTWDHYTTEETELLLRAARTPEDRTLLLFAIRTGARAGEQIGLEWGDIDFANHQIGFKRASIRGVVGPTKSGKPRWVPMTRTLEAALKALRHLKGKRVFCNPDGSDLTIDQLHERLWGASRRAGLRKIRWHDLRHSFASQLAVAGVPIPQIQKWLGHQSIQMTMRYAHLADSGENDRIQVLDRTAVATPWQRAG